MCAICVSEFGVLEVGCPHGSTHAQHPRRASPLPLDADLYKWRHLIDNFFCKLKEFKRIAMRADKTDQSFAANIHLAAAVINSR